VNPWLKKGSGILLLAFLIFSPLDEQMIAEEPLRSPKESQAYQRYHLRPKTELSRLLYLMDRFVGTPIQVIYNGNAYDADRAVKYARGYIARHYQNENVELWIQRNTYRSNPEGRIIYFRYPDGSRRPARDALLEELDKLDRGAADFKN